MVDWAIKGVCRFISFPFRFKKKWTSRLTQDFRSLCIFLCIKFLIFNIQRRIFTVLEMRSLEIIKILQYPISIKQAAFPRLKKIKNLG